MTTRRQFLVAGLSLGSGLTLVSCSPAPPPAPSFADIRFTGEPAFLLQAAQIEIRTFYQPTEADNAFPVSPLRAVQNWARDRLRANGQGGPARFTIANASATIKDLPIKGGLSGTFTDQISQQYDVAVDAALELLDTSGALVHSMRVTASRSRSVLQSATANDRAQVRYDMVRELMSDFDNQATARIASSFGPSLLSG
ncbi:MAG TPA: hypothetical protein VKV32_11560 [Stellaceae bacterium]|nr:hypothetical protein [Stellaceae bacterium]